MKLAAQIRFTPGTVINRRVCGSGRLDTADEQSLRSELPVVLVAVRVVAATLTAATRFAARTHAGLFKLRIVGGKQVRVPRGSRRAG